MGHLESSAPNCLGLIQKISTEYHGKVNYWKKISLIEFQDTLHYITYITKYNVKGQQFFWPVRTLAKQLMCKWVVRWKINIKLGAINTWPSKAASMQCSFALNPFKSSINGRIILLISSNPTYQPANNVFELYQCFLFLLPIWINYSFQILFIRTGLFVDEKCFLS